MKKNLSFLGLIATLLFVFGCSEDNSPNSGEFYVKASINPPIDDVLWGVGGENFSKTSSTESIIQSDPVMVTANENIQVEIGIVGYTTECHQVTADLYYQGKVLKSVDFEMRGMAGTSICKDGFSQLVNIIIPD